MKMSEKTDKLFPALFKVKQAVGSVTKNAKNPHFKNNYADLNTHIEALEPVLQEHGLMLLQPVSTDGGLNKLVTMLVHVESGQWLQSEVTLVNTPDMQKTIAAITYARRGSLNSLFGLASEDDDGETAVGRGTSKPAYQQKEAAPKQQAAQSASPAKEEPKPFNRAMVAKKEEAPAAKETKKDVVW